MPSVTQRIKTVKQPRGGYVNPRSMTLVQLEDGQLLHAKENIHPSLIGTVVDCLTRLRGGTDPQDAFFVSLEGASRLESTGIEVLSTARRALAMLRAGTPLTDEMIVAGCRLVSYDVAVRAGVHLYNPDASVVPDEHTVQNIRTMVDRSMSFFAEYGPVVRDGFTFRGGYTSLVSSGDGDFLTFDTLWDFKVSVNGPTKDHTLQLIMYWRMGLHSEHDEFDSITHLGLFNPRLNRVYRLAVADIPVSVIAEIERDVIGYGVQ